MGVNWSWLLAGGVAALVAYCNVPTSWTMPATAATAQWLKETTLETISPEAKMEIKAGDLWEDHAGREFLNGLSSPPKKKNHMVHTVRSHAPETGAVVMAVRRPG